MPKEPLDEKTETILTQRNFVGISYFHIFTNDKTGEKTSVEATQQEYERLGGVDGAQFNPTLEGHTWKYSMGGAIKVDSPTGLMKDKEYVIHEGKAYVTLDDTVSGGIVVQPDEIVADKIMLVKK